MQVILSLKGSFSFTSSSTPCLSFVVLVVLMQLGFDVVDEVQNVLDHWFLLRRQSAIHLVDFLASVSVDLLCNTLA